MHVCAFDWSDMLMSWVLANNVCIYGVRCHRAPANAARRIPTPQECALTSTPIPHRSEREDFQHSSTRAELAAVVMPLQGTPRADDLAILIDSTAAVQRLRWFRHHDFRPAEHKVKDYDIIHDILLEFKLWSDSSSRTLFVKVHGYFGDPLHEEADRLAHQEIMLVCIWRLRMCFYVTMTLNDIRMSNNFYLIGLRRLIFNPTYICCISMQRHIMLYNIYS